MSPNRSGRGSSGRRGSTGRRGGTNPPRRYPRMARVNETLREVLAEAIARLGDTDDRLMLSTVTAVDCDSDFAAATVLMSSLGPEEAEALEEARIKLQAAVAHQVRLKRTPLLRFAADPAVAAGQRIEDILRQIGPLPDADPDPAVDAGPVVDAGSAGGGLPVAGDLPVTGDVPPAGDGLLPGAGPGEPAG